MTYIRRTTVPALCLVMAMAGPGLGQQIDLPSSGPSSVSGGFKFDYQDLSQRMMAGRSEINQDQLTETLKELGATNAFNSDYTASVPSYASNPAFPGWDGAGVHGSQPLLPQSPPASISIEVVALVNQVSGPFSFVWSYGGQNRNVTLQSGEFRTFECLSVCSSGVSIVFSTLLSDPPSRSILAKGGELYSVRYSETDGFTANKVESITLTLK